MRVPYKKLIEKYDTEFFWSSVLCTKGESINTLESRKECHMEADIFDARAKEKANEKKKAKEKEKAEKSSSARTALASSSSSSP